MSSTYPEGGASGVSSSTTGRDIARNEVAKAREKIGEASEAVRGEAAHFAERAREQVIGQVEEKKSAVSDALAVFADAIRTARDDLGAQEQTFAAQLAGQAADGLQAFSRTISGKTPEAMLQAARDLGRNNPTAFLAGAVLAGVAIGRFARSSAQHEKGPEPAAFQDEATTAMSAGEDSSPDQLGPEA